MQKILIADDDADHAHSLELMLSLAGYDPIVAYDGTSTLKKARELSPDLILLDIDMPGLDGFEVANALGGDRPERPPAIIALSGRFFGDTLEAHASPFHARIAKPADLSRLKALMAELLAERPA